MANLAAATQVGLADDLKIEVTGKPSVLYDSLRDACAPIDVPDINPRAFRDASGNVVMFALHYVNRPLRGRDLTHVKIDCRVALDSRLDPDPAHYDDHSYVASTWTNDGKAVSALVHHEYHADQHHTCRVDDPLGCWFNTVLAYHSNNGGETFTKASPLVVASAPFKQTVEQGRHRGFFNPSNMFRDGAFTYAFISTTGWTGQQPGSCLFRTAKPMDPSSWRAFDGHAFTVRFDDPYASTRKPKPCEMIEPFLLPIGSVVRDKKRNLWIAVYEAPAGGIYPVDGFYYVTGRDLTHWGAPRLLLAGEIISDLCKAGPSVINYPAILDPTSSSRNFDTISDHPLLFFTIIQVEKCQTAQRMLVYQKLDITHAAP